MHSSPYMYLWRKKPWIRENFCGESAPNFIWWVICLFLTDGSTRQLTVHGWMKTIWKRLAKRSIWRRFAVLKKDYYNGGVFRFHDTFSEPWSPKRVHDRPTVCEKQMGARTFWWCMMSHHGNLHGPIRDLEYIYMSNFLILESILPHQVIHFPIVWFCSLNFDICSNLNGSARPCEKHMHHNHKITSSNLI